MRKIFLKLMLAALMTSGLIYSAPAAATGGSKVLPGHVPTVVSHLAATGRLPGTNILHLSIGLPVRNSAMMTSLLAQMYDPASTNYHRFLTPDEFTAQFGPTAQDYQAALDFCSSNGFVVTRTHGNRMVISVDARAADVERSFQVRMNTYNHPTEARSFYSPDGEPSVPAGLSLLQIQGLSSYQLPHHSSRVVPAGNPKPANGSASDGSYLGKDFRNAYVPGSALKGTGQLVGLLQFDGYYASDIATYEQLAGYTNVPLQNVLLDGFNGAPYDLYGGSSEVCLDIEMVVAMAPALSSIVVFEAGPTGNGNDILSSMTASNNIKQLSSSWGYQADNTTEQLYQQLALQGQTYLNCSGDGDAWLGSIPYQPVQDAYVTIVGGTTLTMRGSGNSYVSERVWNSGNVGDYGWNPDGYAGSSGGISTSVLIPSWQQKINMSANQGSTVFRNVPDISLTADNIFLVFAGGVQSDVQGTSAATPLWAGYIALVNQQAVAAGKSSVGFLAPTVYAIAGTPNYTNCFHDITVGDNTWDQSTNYFFATAGYDLCTGLGTPNGTNLINAIVATLTNTTPTLVVSAPTGPWGTNMSLFNGSNPNGDWFLFIQDDAPLNTGMITNGWYLTLTTANPVGYASDNAIYASLTNTTIGYGANYTVTIGVTNYGPSASTNVVVTDNLPLPLAGLPLISSNATLGTIALIGANLTWNVGNLSVSNGAALTLTFRGYGTGNYTNIATVASLTDDPNPDDDTIVSYITVSAPPPPPTLAGFGYAGGSANQFQFTVNGSAVQTVVQASTNLVNWANVFTGTPPFIYTNFGTTNYPQRFYRAVIGP